MHAFCGWKVQEQCLRRPQAASPGGEAEGQVDGYMQKRQ